MIRGEVRVALQATPKQERTMGDTHPGPTTNRPVVRTPSELDEIPAQQTPGIRRRQAFAGEDRWIGHVETQPGEWSGWHHHGETDTYLYVLDGSLEFEFGTDGDHVAVGRGDFAHVPAGVVHRERTASGRPGDIVLVRVGRGPAVVNVDGPNGAG
jgi:mannose-6-phosphate isomerase-like protein (cupin superfamily)